eukprot:TRINITY_DN8121_c4_g1_i2.p2 TRINITY_DN8121_c4_g1~~TRINITY_DN8121_c4_g1_i2.p2  ORF type:complete len:110 (-),score=10.91 TRINITY_DN8121_c4_g1_i2:1146-1475(-)
MVIVSEALVYGSRVALTIFCIVGMQWEEEGRIPYARRRKDKRKENRTTPPFGSPLAINKDMQRRYLFDLKILLASSSSLTDGHQFISLFYYFVLLFLSFFFFVFFIFSH